MTKRDTAITPAGGNSPFLRQRPIPALLLLLFSLSCLPVSTVAEEISSTPWQISADRLTHSREPQEVLAEGNVVLEGRQDGQGKQLTLRADWIKYQIENEQVRAKGDLTLLADRDVITAATAEVNLGRRTGTFTDATLFYAENNLYLSGRRLEKTGPETYLLEDGLLTTCTPAAPKSPPWSFVSQNASIGKSGYAVMEKVSFRLRNTPVLYLPYLILPARNNRQSGFLFPELTQSKRDGSGLITPLFINLSPSADITLYPGYLSKRGPVAGLESRYSLSPHSKGTLAINYLHDDITDNAASDYKEDGYLRTTQERYWLRAKIDHDFGANLFGRLDFDLVSDRDYLQEFNKGLIGFGASNEEFTAAFKRGFQTDTIPLRESSLQLSKSWENANLFGELRGVQDVRDEPGLESPLWTLPRLAFAGAADFGVTPLALTWESEYINYRRDEGIGTQRLDVYPRLIAPLPLAPYLEAAAAAGLRQTLYLVNEQGAAAGSWPHDNWQSRTLADFEISVATTLERNFSLGAGSGREPLFLDHLLRPELTYLYTPDIKQDKLPQLDYRDTIAGRDWLGYRLYNLFSLGEGDSFARRQEAILKISQYYDLENDDRPFSDLFLELELSPTRGLQIALEAAVSFYGQGLPYYDLTAHYSNDHGLRIATAYRYKRNPGNGEPFFHTAGLAESSHEFDGTLQLQITPLISLGYKADYSLATDTVIDSSLRLTYHPACWSMELTATKTPDDSRAMLVFSLTGIGKALAVGLPEI